MPFDHDPKETWLPFLRPAQVRMRGESKLSILYVHFVRFGHPTRGTKDGLLSVDLVGRPLVSRSSRRRGAPAPAPRLGETKALPRTTDMRTRANWSRTSVTPDIPSMFGSSELTKRTAKVGFTSCARFGWLSAVRLYRAYGWWSVKTPL